MNRIKPIAIAVAVLLAVIIVFQNTESVETRLLFAKVVMPRAVLLITTAAVGFLAGLVVSGRSRRRGDGSDKES